MITLLPYPETSNVLSLSMAKSCSSFTVIVSCCSLPLLFPDKQDVESMLHAVVHAGPRRGMPCFSFPPIKILLFLRLNSYDTSTVFFSASNRMTPEISQLFEFCLYSHDDEYPGLPLTVLCSTYISLSN